MFFKWYTIYFNIKILFSNFITFNQLLFMIAFIYFFPWSLFIFDCFSKFFPKREYVNLACSISLLWSEGSTPSPVRYLYLSTFPDDSTDIFASSLLIPYYSFSSLIWSSIVMIKFYIPSKRFFLKREVLPDVRVASITKNEYSFAVHFIKIHKLPISDEWLNAIC